MQNRYSLQWFETLTFHGRRYVIYGVGQQVGHFDDWRGPNFWHGRLPDSPVFDTVADATAWLKLQIKNGTLEDGLVLPGHHSGAVRCSKGCTDREVGEAIFFNQPRQSEPNA